MNILLLNGHGAGDVGASGNGYQEYKLTRELADLVQERLKKYATVYRYPKDRNAYTDLENGVFNKHMPIAFSKLGYALEIHFNGFRKDEVIDGIFKGSECFVVYSEKGITVEQAIMRGMKKFFPLRDNDNIFDGVKRTNFAVIQALKNNGVSGALLETCFIDDKDDITKYQKNKNAIADAIVNGIVEGFGLKKDSGGSTDKPAQKPSKPSTGKTYKVVKTINGYNTSNDAKNRKNATTTVKAGTYNVFNESDGMINVSKDKDPGAWINPADNKTSGGSTNKPESKKKLYLPANASSWRVYPTNKKPVVGNECGYLYPSKFGGLTYDVLATPQKDVVTIQTRDYGRVNIYVGAGTGATIK